jgi:hypothetical protein
MRPRSPKLLVLTLAGTLVGCAGNVGDLGPPGGNTGTGAGPGSGGAGSGSGGTGAGTGGAGGTVAPGAPRPIDLAGNPKYYRFVRLTNEQWANAVRDLFKLPAPSPLASNFPSTVSGSTAFNNNELLLDVTSRLWGDYQTAAETLAAQVTATDAALRNVYTGTADATSFIQTFGRRVYRRPLTPAEVATYQPLYTAGSMTAGTQSAFTKGAALVIEAMLQSPFFLYRSEQGPNGMPLSSYEMAAKLSLFLRETTPSDALLDAAASTATTGRLDTVDGAATLATTMLGEATATAVMRRFHGEMLDVDTFANVSKVGVPSYRESLNSEFVEASYRFFDNLYIQGLGLREMLTSTKGFVGPGLAPLYGVAAPASGFVERDLGARRVGFFSQIPYLAKNAVNLEAHPIHRGVSINLEVLCADLEPPNPNLPEVPALKPDQTNRERYEGLTMACGGACHNSYINPLGFAFENFDGMGQWRETENGKPINAAGSYPFAEGVKSFTNVSDLMTTIAQGEQAHTCYGKKLAGFALQRDIVAADMPLLSSLKTAGMAANGSIKQVILELVKNPAFRTRVGGAQ